MISVGMFLPKILKRFRDGRPVGLPEEARSVLLPSARTSWAVGRGAAFTKRFSAILRSSVGRYRTVMFRVWWGIRTGGV